MAIPSGSSTAPGLSTPTSEGSTTRAPSGEGPVAVPGVDVVPADLPEEDAAVLDGFAQFMGDWMAVVGSPSDQALQSSENATPDGQVELVQAGQTLVEAGNSIQGVLRLDDVDVSVTARTSAELTTCLDQSGTRLVAQDGTELEGSDSPRVAASASLVRLSGAWRVVVLDISGDPC